MLAALLLAAATPAVPPPVDPLAAEVESADARRFAALWERTGGKPTAEQIQRAYLDPGSYGVQVFTPNRIESATHLAAVIAAHPKLYDRAVRECLPVIAAMSDELRATYLAMHGLLPEQPLPHIYLVVGANNSGGTAGSGAQVLGLEVLCRISDTPEKLRETVRAFFAHETVHVFQSDAMTGAFDGTLLNNVLAEGAADFIATLVTGRQIDPARAAWGRAHEAELWQQFTDDLAMTRGSSEPKRGSPAAIAVHRWIGNAGDAPPGWPGEVGYWIGQRIWERWYAKQPNKHAAIRRMLTLDRLDEILAGGAFSAE
jgi:hypothetical protein